MTIATIPLGHVEHPGLASWRYADAYLREPKAFRQLPMPTVELYYRGPGARVIPRTEPGLWVPLSCAVALVVATSKASVNGNNVTTDAVDSSGGTLCVALVSDYRLTPVTTPMSDNKSNTWVKRTPKATGVYSRATIWDAFNATVGTGHTFTYSTTSTFPGLAILIFSGVLATSTPFDVENGATVNSGVTTLQTGSVTPSLNGEVLCTLIGSADVNALSIDSSFTKDGQINWVDGKNFGNAFAHKIQSTAGAENPTWSGLSSALDYATVIATYKAAVVGSRFILLAG